jgi:hypothetical protein
VVFRFEFALSGLLRGSGRAQVCQSGAAEWAMQPTMRNEQGDP